MAEADCHASEGASPRDRAKTLVLKDLGVKRVAAWVGVTEDAVYQGLGRASDDNPVPRSWVAKIVSGARAEGIAVSVGVLWPAMAGTQP